MGDSAMDQIFKIFQVLGTPNDQNWPGVSSLPDFKPNFPQWAGIGLQAKVPNLDAAGLDLLQRMLVYEPSKRLTAREALQHEYFADVVAPPEALAAR